MSAPAPPNRQKSTIDYIRKAATDANDSFMIFQIRTKDNCAPQFADMQAAYEQLTPASIESVDKYAAAYAMVVRAVKDHSESYKTVIYGVIEAFTKEIETNEALDDKLAASFKEYINYERCTTIAIRNRIVDFGSYPVCRILQSRSYHNGKVEVNAAYILSLIEGIHQAHYDFYQNSCYKSQTLTAPFTQWLQNVYDENDIDEDEQDLSPPVSDEAKSVIAHNSEQQNQRNADRCEQSGIALERAREVASAMKKIEAKRHTVRERADAIAGCKLETRSEIDEFDTLTRGHERMQDTSRHGHSTRTKHRVALQSPRNGKFAEPIPAASAVSYSPMYDSSVAKQQRYIRAIARHTTT